MIVLCTSPLIKDIRVKASRQVCSYLLVIPVRPLSAPPHPLLQSLHPLSPIQRVTVTFCKLFYFEVRNRIIQKMMRDLTAKYRELRDYSRTSLLRKPRGQE